MGAAANGPKRSNALRMPPNSATREMSVR